MIDKDSIEFSALFSTQKTNAHFVTLKILGNLLWASWLVAQNGLKISQFYGETKNQIMRDVIYEQSVSSDPFASDDEFAMSDIVNETKDTLTRDFKLQNTHTV
jgi:hypothetical protein